MAFLDVEVVRVAARDPRQRVSKSDSEILGEARRAARDKFDIFLSHSSMDKELIVGAKRIIEKADYTVYVDWIDDAELERAAVDRDRADHLRRRMQQCESLFYLHTPNAALSRWRPWELGFFDALRQPDRRMFVLPIVRDGQQYKGQEYFDVYETVDLERWSRPAPHRAGRPADHFADPLIECLLDDRFGILGRGGRIL